MVRGWLGVIRCWLDGGWVVVRAWLGVVRRWLENN